MAYKPDKHGRDHCPGGEDPIPCLGGTPVFHAYQDSTFQSIPDGATTVLLFDTWTISDESVYDVTLVGSQTSGAELFKAGVYTFTCCMEWAANWNATMFLSLLSDYDFSQVAGFPGSAGGWVGSPTASFTLCMPAPFEPVPGAMGVSWTVRQHSGVARNTDFGTFMQCHYHGPIGAPIS